MMLRQVEDKAVSRAGESHSQSFSVSFLYPTLLQFKYSIPWWSFFPQVPSALASSVAFLDLLHLYPDSHSELEAVGVVCVAPWCGKSVHRSAEKSRYKQINKAVYVLAFPLPGKWLSDIKS